MAWRQPGDKPLSEPMMVSLLMHIYVTRPQWVNGHICPSIWCCSAYVWQITSRYDFEFHIKTKFYIVRECLQKYFVMQTIYLNFCSYITWVSQITNNSTVCSTASSGYQKKKNQSYTLLALCEGNLMMDSPYKGAVVPKAFPCHKESSWHDHSVLRREDTT